MKDNSWADILEPGMVVRKHLKDIREFRNFLVVRSNGRLHLVSDNWWSVAGVEHNCEIIGVWKPEEVCALQSFKGKAREQVWPKQPEYLTIRPCDSSCVQINGGHAGRSHVELMIRELSRWLEEQEGK